MQAVSAQRVCLTTSACILLSSKQPGFVMHDLTKVSKKSANFCSDITVLENPSVPRYIIFGHKLTRRTRSYI
ncbi:hypothetical protein IQ06DRAFT_295312 [Phaeosphaeriaceae sp. SRC1lsM3a]|nr:hypothetical protein IQ06DRAFT_295312 [Stagonospora sp. SRC1lsM3a]